MREVQTQAPYRQQFLLYTSPLFCLWTRATSHLVVSHKKNQD